MRAAGLLRIWAERDRRYALTRKAPLTPDQVDYVRFYRSREAAELGDLALADKAWAWKPPVTFP